MTEALDAPTWHQALAYAVTGRRFPQLGRQHRPDLAVLAAFLTNTASEEVARPELVEGTGGVARPEPVEGLDEVVRRWHLVPPDLLAGIGAAQLAAAVADLRGRLAPARRPAVPVVADRALTRDEQRLLREVPPHHGS